MFSKSTVKYIQSLQHKKFRDQYNVFVAEGPRVIAELLQTDAFICRNLFALPAWISTMDDALIQSLGERIETIQDFELEKIAAYSTANKVIAVFEKRIPQEKISLKNKLTLVLDDIRDPGNLGTIIRTADWFGIENIICSENTVDIYNPKVVQSTMASLGSVNVMYADLTSWFKNNNSLPIIAAVLDGEPANEFKNVKEALIIIGNESNGISEDVLALASKKITIPKNGSAESLNAAIATGIILYALTHNN